jgi:hypothetical protein
MAKHNCIGNADLCKGGLDQFRLGIGRPHDATRTFAVAEAGAIENDDPVILGSEVDQTAGFEVRYHASVAMQKYHRVTCASFDVVKPDAIHIKESARRRIVTFRFVRETFIDEGGGGESCNCYRRGSNERRCLAITTPTWNCSAKTLQ